MFRRIGLAACGLLLVAVGGCGGEGTRDFSQSLGGFNGGHATLSFRYPKAWHVTGFSRTVSPPRLVVTSYKVPRNAVEGDCGGREAMLLLPPDGATVLLMDMTGGGSGYNFAPLPKHPLLSDGSSADYECFGRSVRFAFRVGARDFLAHVALGAHAAPGTRHEALGILGSLKVSGG